MKKNYPLLAAMLFSGVAVMAQPGNYLVNGGFEDGMRGWNGYSGSTSIVTFSMDETNPISGSQSARMDISGTGGVAYESSFQQKFTVHQDKEVQVEFKIRASAATFVNLEVCRGYGDYNPIIRSTDNVVATPNIAVGTDVQTVSYTATAPYSDANYIFSLQLGITPGDVTIWIDDVMISQTDNAWDGNILPNSEFNEVWPTDESFPDWKQSQIAFSIFPWVDGGWEGGFQDQAAFPTQNLTFGIDQTNKLSGANSFRFNVTNKPEAGGFWSAFNTVFFPAVEGELYEFTVDIVASQNATMSVAMNVEPWPAVIPPDLFFLDLPATTTPQTFTIATNAPIAQTQFHKIFFANLPAGTNYQIYIDNVRLKRVGGADPVSTRNNDNAISGVKVFPNPAAFGNFTIDLSASNIVAGKNLNIELFNLEGKKVHGQSEAATNGQIEVSKSLPAGVYIVRITCENSVFMQKLIMQ